jgi:hypothetical protein
MNLRFLGFLGLWAICGFSCSGETLDVVDDLVVDGGGGSGGVGAPPPPAPPPASSVSPSEPKGDFDPCPEDTYVLWEEDGVTYTIVIEVFCEPVMDMNLGCPAPNVR